MVVILHTLMKLNPVQIQYVCERILRDLKEKDLVVFKIEESKVLKRMIVELEKNLKEEDAIEDEARKLMERHDSEVSGGGINKGKLLMMLKKEIAKKKRFVL